MPHVDTNQNVDSHGRGDMQRRAAGTANGHTHKGPSAYTMVRSFVGAVTRVATATAYGHRPYVSGEIYQQRLDVCKTCKHFNAAKERCNLCGCYARLKLKLATEQCPLKPPKWGKTI